MVRRALPLLLIAVVATACSSASGEPSGYDNPERAVVAWFEAIDSRIAAGASEATNDASLALILGVENGVDTETIASYLADGIPADVQAAYWKSFAEEFMEFASRPISTLTVGESQRFESQGLEFASVPIAGGGGGESVVIVRATSDGSWEIDLIATLGDGFVQVLAGAFDRLTEGGAADQVRSAYGDVVVPALWAAMAVGAFGDDFSRVALGLIDKVNTQTR